MPPPFTSSREGGFAAAPTPLPDLEQVHVTSIASGVTVATPGYVPVIEREVDPSLAFAPGATPERAPREFTAAPVADPVTIPDFAGLASGFAPSNLSNAIAGQANSLGSTAPATPLGLYALAAAVVVLLALFFFRR